MYTPCLLAQLEEERDAADTRAATAQNQLATAKAEAATANKQAAIAKAGAKHQANANNILQKVACKKLLRHAVLFIGLYCPPRHGSTCDGSRHMTQIICMMCLA